MTYETCNMLPSLIVTNNITMAQLQELSRVSKICNEAP